ncbi:hypothetical protein JB92DRAFT_1817718 [Gautieria morchelliformis]|nr:hypothetical protein JB92DRAFT_1817718 [Gautieria morchelliformis]
MQTATIHRAWLTYTEELAMLGHGLPLWQPAPLDNYDKIKIGDVGYIRQGRFHLLFSASMPQGGRILGEDVPLDFVPFEPGPTAKDQPRGPGALHARYIKQIGAAFNISANATCIDAGTTFNFKTSSTKGAILMTKYQTFCEDAERWGRFEDYMRQHYQSWHDHANKLGHRVKLEDILFITGHDMTRDFDMVAFSSDSKEAGIKFSAGIPGVGSATTAAWGTWDSSISVSRNFGPQPRDPPGDLQLLTYNTHPMDSFPKYNQCVFLRGYRIKRRARIVPRVIRAAAGPHDLGSGHRSDKEDLQAEWNSSSSDSYSEILMDPDPPFVDPLTPFFDYIFDVNLPLCCLNRGEANS